MSSRVENVIDESVSREANRVLAIPRGTVAVQVVLHRDQFEDLISKDREVCIVAIRVDGQNAGRVGWAGGRAEARARPLQRQLWSTAYWPIPKGSRSLEIRVRTAQTFRCKIDVDFLT